MGLGLGRGRRGLFVGFFGARDVPGVTGVKSILV